MQLTFRLLSFWQVGTGGGEMGTFDSRAARDPLGLPLIPGRQVKGLCRQAVYDAELMRIEGVPAGSSTRLFGTRSLGTDDDGSGAPIEPADHEQGCLRFTDARLAEADRQALGGRPEAIAQLYVSRRSTAMNERGTAKAHSLRYDELVIPVNLIATVTAAHFAPADWQTILKAALPLINAVGSGRTRGLGRVIVKAEG